MHVDQKQLDRLGLVFEDIDVTKDQTAANDARRIGRRHGQSFPVVVVSNGNGQDVWAGFKLDKIRGLIA